MDNQSLSEEYFNLDAKTQDEMHDAAVKRRQKIVNNQGQSLMNDSDNLLPEEDKFNRYPIAEIIARHVASSESINTYSIDGPWGSGKTVLLRWLEKELQRKYQNEVVVISFDPWKYESLGNIVYPLIGEMRSLAKGSEFDKKINKVLQQILLLGGGVVAWKYLGLVTALKLWISLRSIKNKLEQEVVLLNNLQESFEDLVNYILQSLVTKPRKIVFLIDDLDRCTPDNVLLMLESVKNFLNIPKTCFVFAVDRRVVSQGIKVKYGNLSEIDGNEYLEKIIQFSFEIPFDAKFATFQLMRDYQKNNKIIHANLEFAPELFRLLNIKSIRFIKKVFNRYVITYELGYNTYQGSFNPQIYFLINLLNEYSPHFYQMIGEYRPSNLLLELDKTDYNYLDTLQPNPKLSIGIKKLVAEVPETKAIKLMFRHFIQSIVYSANQSENDRNIAKQKFNDDLFFCMDIYSKYGIKETETEKAIK